MERMITIEIKKSGGDYASFSCRGHAGYAEEGYDIICAAVSALTVNTINAIERFTDDAFEGSASDGDVSWNFTQFPLSKECILLMDTLVMGLEEIRDSYGKKYIKIVKKA